MKDHSRYRQLANLTRLINTKLQLKEMLEAVTEAISEEVFQCDSVGIYMPQADGSFRGYTGKPDFINGMTIDMHVIDPKNDALVREVVEKNRPVYIPDTASDERPSDWAVDSFLIRSLLVLPISFGDELFGLVFLFNYGQPMNITDEQRETVEAFVNMAAVAIRNANDLHRKEDLLQEKQFLLNVNRELSRCETMQDAIEICFRYIGEVLKNDNAAVHLLDPLAGRKIEPAKLSKQSSWSEDEWLKVHKMTVADILSDKVYQEAVQTRKPIFIPDVTKDSRPDPQVTKAFGIRGLSVFPLVAMNEVLGFIAVPNLSDELVDYPKSVQQLAQSVVDSTASTLSNLLYMDKQEMIIEERTSQVREKNRELERVVTELENLSREKELILSSAGEGIFGLDLQGHMTFCNPAGLEMLGFEREEDIVGLPCGWIFWGDPAKTTGCAVGPDNKPMVQVDRFYRKDATSFPVEYDLSLIQEGDDVFGQVVIFKDITERRQLEDEIKYYAYYDSLTDLPNRLLLRDRLDHALTNAALNKEQLAVLFLDLDRFKLINDTFGHSFGDLLLKEVAIRLSTSIPETGIVSRQGGDEFMIILLDVKTKEEVIQTVERVNAAFAEPILLEGHEIFIKNSIGIAVYPEDGTDAEALIRKADTAMYRSKEVAGGSFHFYHEGMGRRTIENVKYENALYRALERDEFVLFYQPQMDYCTGEMAGVEALIRWQHPTEGLIPPNVFIPLAEQTGLIVPIGEWVLREAAGQLMKWMDAGYAPVNMAVNLSAAQFEQDDLVTVVEQVLADTGIPPRYLHLELTENQLMRDSELAINTMHRLKKLGVQIAIDDFGTGYSSLGYLQKFPVSTLKIDRSFIRDLMDDDDDRALTDTIITMADNLGMEVIAEGVETEPQADYLAARSCALMQGYFFSPPIPAKQLEKRFLKNK
ncbi:EAL domain-containing protein [Bhargavaea ullalensis]|uniref:Diguanylate cyclase (GGDEF)-like protein/PAS domain S-box-containing protein n=1 Tax=Bhargavaea ullalensis TaxID=1265685 RepID=A0ABV2GA92_9BACL